MAGTDRDWMLEAACRGRDDLDWFDMGCSVEACMAVCATCPVGDLCLDYAIRNRCTDGIWAGEYGYRLEQLVRGAHDGKA